LRISEKWNVNSFTEDFIDYEYDKENDNLCDYHYYIKNSSTDINIYINILDNIYTDEIVKVVKDGMIYNFRIVKYKINDNDYCIMTNMFNVDHKKIQNIYHKR
jgi:hypothetical protein